MYSIADVINAVASPDTQWRSLKGVEPTYNKGEMIYMTGNSSVVMPVIVEGQEMVLKCYIRQKRHLAQIYGDRFLPQELTIRNILGEVHRADCLLMPMLKGVTLDAALCNRDIPMEQLADAFERMVLRLMERPEAHGDIKPENIILTPQGELHLIDWDAAFIPTLATEQATELGTAAYQHPRRTAQLYNKHIDDYSIAYLLTILRGATIDETIREEYSHCYEFYPSPHQILSGQGQRIEHLAEEFASRAMVKEYRLSQMLLSPQPTLPMLTTVLTPTLEWEMDDDMSIEQSGGLWGLRNGQRWVIAPIYDTIMEPCDGLIAATAAGYGYVISLHNRKAICIGKDVRVKLSSQSGLVVAQSDGNRKEIPMEELLQNLGK